MGDATRWVDCPNRQGQRVKKIGGQHNEIQWHEQKDTALVVRESRGIEKAGWTGDQKEVDKKKWKVYIPSYLPPFIRLDFGRFFILPLF